MLFGIEVLDWPSICMLDIFKIRQNTKTVFWRKSWPCLWTLPLRWDACLFRCSSLCRLLSVWLGKGVDLISAGSIETGLQVLPGRTVWLSPVMGSVEAVAGRGGEPCSMHVQSFPLHSHVILSPVRSAAPEHLGSPQLLLLNYCLLICHQAGLWGLRGAFYSQLMYGWFTVLY